VSDPTDQVKPPTPTPTISIVVCAYTDERLELLAAGVESLRNQTVAPHELVLVIDHAPELEAIARERWPDAQIVANSEQQGLSGARNTGVAECSGEIVAFLDDDAAAAPNWIERLGAAYLDPNVLGAGGSVRPNWETERPGWFPPEFDWVVGCTHSGMPQQVQAVRNLVGANMSFRREALLEAGGFRHELGRIGKIPAGAEETDLSIRVAQQNPGCEILYDPGAAVDHFVPAERASFEYFTSRCRGEGRSKAILAALVGGGDGLSEERTYTSRTLPLGFLRGIGDAFRGDVDGLARAAMLVVGLATTTRGYLGGQGEARRIAERREQAEAPPRPLRVLMVTPRSPLLQGGVERHVMETSRRIAASGAGVEVLCTEPGGPKLTEEVRDGVTIRTVRSWPADRDWCLAPRLWREISRQPWDVVHVQSYHTLVAPLAMLRALTLRIPYVVTFHGGGHSQAHRNKARSGQRRLLRPLLARAARLVAVARFEIDEYGGELGLGPDHFALIPNGTDLAFAETGAAPRRNGAATIATIGRLERYKGHHRVIEAFPEVLSLKPETTLTVVGSGPYEDDLRRLAAELGVAERVVFTSTPADQPRAMAELLSGISVVVLMSEFETHPLVALEAAAAGCRLLVADASGLGELAREGFARAIPLDEDPAAVGRAVVEELGKPPQDKRPSLSSWDECADRLLELYGAVAQA
jgi:glycosyltransferase involved in cell wall biosynthesis/GT2 family glycosyltransferase